MPNEPEKHNWVSQNEFTQFENAVDRRFDDLGRNMNTGFASLTQSIAELRNNAKAPVGAILTATGLLLVIIGVYVTPVKSQADGLEDRVWNVETSYIPEAVVASQFADLGGRINNNTTLSNELVEKTSERWGRVSETLGAHGREIDRVRDWQIARGNLEQLVKSEFARIDQLLAAESRRLDDNIDGAVKRLDKIENSRFDENRGELIEDRVTRIEERGATP